MAQGLMTTRRGAIAGATGIAALAATAGAAAIAPPDTVSFVLVHGAWHGGWCWREVAGQLRNREFDVHTPTMTGLGERQHLGRADTGLMVHATDIAALIEAEELTNVVLVLHSYAGLPGSYASARLPERIRRVVYLDSLLPVPGTSVIGQMPADQRTAVETSLVDGFRLPPFPVEALDVPRDSFQYPWVARRLTAMPVAPFTDVQPALPPAYDGLAKTYITCTANTLDGPKDGLRRARAMGLNVLELASGHDAMVTAPTETANLLASLA